MPEGGVTGDVSLAQRTAANSGPVSKGKLAEQLGCDQRNLKLADALTQLVEDGVVEEVEFTAGNNRKAEGYQPATVGGIS